ncbi:tRNA (adenosine(37)-N6)-threonylcarbamoyltransferase complex dimerization subunit type 1 TsaB [Verrucomicrobiaceae bacterium N1E253]|uniref:tRNA (Adenosine(37)-N6)-threonylcarbamoyltransferase complex dimerization subunit type 1 TsaB n=1 Tax=Oceaniferula marina TaxID=2748318 RepID=A0A851GMM8_9BACT|nr:tRNA (adenosine(37)-N6)-threonylcarbamoyltransferase complex dimerization subunit type 1 TsaB [Oceaniferula marina]NWK55364.1 tRNA (adenosine(37)-N6)-threonylcarbamoyltransferase complex dimerization subunit type 1 TsaB [Oceaniferula marina]
MHAILALETSVAQASVVLWLDGGIHFEQTFTTDRSHNSMIFDPLEEALGILGKKRLDLVVAGTGPGSYSGTRVGIAAGQGLAIAHKCPAVGIGSLGATPEARAEGPSIAIGDARRGLYYLSTIQNSGEASEPELMDAAAFQQRLTEAADHRLFTLDDPDKLGLDENLRARVIRSRPEARWLLDLWLHLPADRQQALHTTPLAPAYLRPPFTSKAKPGHPLLR